MYKNFSVVQNRYEGIQNKTYTLPRENPRNVKKIGKTPRKGFVL